MAKVGVTTRRRWLVLAGLAVVASVALVGAVLFIGSVPHSGGLPAAGQLSFGPGTSVAAPSASAASPSSAAIGPCRTTELLISVTNTGAAAGNVGGYLLFENKTAEACTLQGAPTLTAITLAGAATRARFAATTGTPFPSLTQPPLVILGPGDKAFAAYGGSDNPGSGTATCPPPYHTFQVTPPGNAISVDLLAFNAWLDQDQPSCAGIEVTVIAPASEVEQFNDLSSLRP